jgi:hypothetical protein
MVGSSGSMVKGDRVVPLAVDGMAGERHGGEFGVGDLDAG